MTDFSRKEKPVLLLFLFCHLLFIPAFLYNPGNPQHLLAVILMEGLMSIAQLIYLFAALNHDKKKPSPPESDACLDSYRDTSLRQSRIQKELHDLLNAQFTYSSMLNQENRIGAENYRNHMNQLWSQSK